MNNLIKTNFNEKTHLVLSDENKKIVAVIEVEAGKNVDITAKLTEAIKDEISDDEIDDILNPIRFQKSMDLDEFAYDIDFNISYEEGEEMVVGEFNLTKTCLY
jgi:hypothetical protein